MYFYVNHQNASEYVWIPRVLHYNKPFIQQSQYPAECSSNPK